VRFGGIHAHSAHAFAGQGGIVGMRDAARTRRIDDAVGGRADFDPRAGRSGGGVIGTNQGTVVLVADRFKVADIQRGSHGGPCARRRQHKKAPDASPTFAAHRFHGLIPSCSGGLSAVNNRQPIDRTVAKTRRFIVNQIPHPPYLQGPIYGTVENNGKLFPHFRWVHLRLGARHHDRLDSDVILLDNRALCLEIKRGAAPQAAYSAGASSFTRNDPAMEPAGRSTIVSSRYCPSAAVSTPPTGMYSCCPTSSGI